MAIKKNIAVLLIILVILAVNLIPTGIMPDNSSYYKDLEYLGLYNANGFLTGETEGVFNMPLNTNHLLLTALKLLPGNVFPNIILTVLYLIILGISLFILIKSVKNYGFLVGAAIALLLCTKKYISYFFTILPFGGIFTFLISSLCLIIACSVRKKTNFPLVISAAVFAVAFAMYDNITALCGVILGVLIARLMSAADRKALKYTTAVLSIAIIVISLLFAFNYKGNDYNANIVTAVDYGIKNYEDASASSYTQIAGFYLKNPQYAVQHIQTLINNAFYEPDEMPFSLWHEIKVKLIPLNVLVFAALSIALIVFAVIHHKKYSLVSEAFISTIVMMWIALTASGIIFGISNLDKNLLLFNLLFDILMCMFIVSVIYIIKGRRNELKEKYGVTQ